MGETIWTKTAGYGGVTVDREHVYVNGEQVGRNERYAVKLTRAQEIVKDGQRYTHVIGRKVALTAVEAESFDAAMTAWIRAQPLPLDAQRAKLVNEIGSLRDEQTATFERLHAREDARAWSAKNSYEPKIAAAAEALAAFDAEHPEIIAAIREQREIERQRNLRAAEWN